MDLRAVRCEFVLYDKESWWHAPKTAENFRTLWFMWSPSFSSNAPPGSPKTIKTGFLFTQDYFLSRELVSSKIGDYYFHSLRLPAYQVGLTRLGQQRNQRPPLGPQKGAKHAKAALPPLRDVWGVSWLTSFSIMMCNMLPQIYASNLLVKNINQNAWVGWWSQVSHETNKGEGAEK